MKKMNSSLLPTSYWGNVNKKSEYLLRKFEVVVWMKVFAGKTVKSSKFHKKTAHPSVRCGLNENGLCQLIVNVVPAVLDRNGAAALAAGHHGDGLSAVTAKREQKCIQFLIIGINALNDVFLTFHSGC